MLLLLLGIMEMLEDWNPLVALFVITSMHLDFLVLVVRMILAGMVASLVPVVVIIIVETVMPVVTKVVLLYDDELVLVVTVVFSR